MQPPGKLAINNLLFSDDQRKVMRVCLDQIQNENPSIKRCIIQGKAGTGKSAVIRAICQLLDKVKHASDGNEAGKLYQVLAPTGAAASNVNGRTIHSFLRLPVNLPFKSLEGEQLESFQSQMRHIKFIIIDEYSMVGRHLLCKIHNRLCQARKYSDEPFNGYFIYLFGDLRQLPPVLDTAIYLPPDQDPSCLSVKLVNSFQHTIVLSVNHRQDANQGQFKSLLDSIATGTVNIDGWRLLMTRCRKFQPANISSFGHDAIRLFSTNKRADEFNMQVLSQNGHPVVLLDAINNNSMACQASDVVAGGLPRRIYLSLGCRIMLRKNLCVDKGLVNGALGTVLDIVYLHDQKPPSPPDYISVRFDHLDENQDHCRISAAETDWIQRDIMCTRKQFPLILAFALTIHKAQGLTLDKAVVDIGDRENALGLTYVALSRVRRIEDLLVSNSFDFNRLARIAQSRDLRQREKFLVQISTPATSASGSSGTFYLD